MSPGMFWAYWAYCLQFGIIIMLKPDPGSKSQKRDSMTTERNDLPSASVHLLWKSRRNSKTSRGVRAWNNTTLDQHATGYPLQLTTSTACRWRWLVNRYWWVILESWSLGVLISSQTKLKLVQHCSTAKTAETDSRYLISPLVVVDMFGSDIPTYPDIKQMKWRKDSKGQNRTNTYKL